MQDILIQIFIYLRLRQWKKLCLFINEAHPQLLGLLAYVKAPKEQQVT